jgi:tripartite-type tricarboxylate transporter receptor subunit TctC
MTNGKYPDRYHPDSGCIARIAPAVMALLQAILPSFSHAQDKPSKYPGGPIRMVVGFSAGGGPDVAARLLAPQMTTVLGQQVIVDNRPGAGGSIGEAIVAKAPADGYTLLMCASSLSINPSLYPKLPYDPIRDLAPISLMGVSAQALIVLSTHPARNVRELIALAKAQPGVLTFASSGNGSGSHLAGELFKFMTNANIVHVPYKGGGQGVTAVMSGETVLMFAPLAAAIPHVRSGRLRTMAVTTAKRSAAASDIPTMAEAGVPGYAAFPWYGLFAPTGTPQAVIDVLQKATAAIVAQPSMRERMLSLGIDPVGNGSAEFAGFVKVEMDKWSEVIRKSGLQLN